MTAPPVLMTEGRLAGIRTMCAHRLASAGDVPALLSHIDALTARLAASEADAARYRFVRDNGLLDGYIVGYEIQNDMDETVQGTKKYAANCDAAIDAAIDAARSPAADGRAP